MSAGGGGTTGDPRLPVDRTPAAELHVDRAVGIDELGSGCDHAGGSETARPQLPVAV